MDGLAEFEGRSSMGKVSIALCTFNGDTFLPEQIESYLSQTRLPDELVVGDDGSTDSTLEILENFANDAPFPVYITSNIERLGPTRNFGETILRCTGDLIFLSDQDDVWENQKIEGVLSEFERNPTTGFVFSDALLVNEALEPVGDTLSGMLISEVNKRRLENGDNLEALLDRSIAGGLTCAFRVELRKAFSPIPTQFPKLLHDYWIALICASVSETRYLPECLVKYRLHDQQETKRLWGSTAVDKIKVSDFGTAIDSLEGQAREFSFLLRHLAALDLSDEGKERVRRSSTTIENRIADIEMAIKHFKSREEIATSKRRISNVAKELSTGRYHRYSRGYLSALKDLTHVNKQRSS